MKNDNVNHPAHYNHDGLETIDVIKAWTKDLNPFEAYCMGNVIKYISRWKDKNGIEDLKKARWYLIRVIGEENKEKVRQYPNKNIVDEKNSSYFDAVFREEKNSEDKKEEDKWEQECPWTKVSPDIYETLAQKMKESPSEPALNYCSIDASITMDMLLNSLEKFTKGETLDKITAAKAFNKNELFIVFTADGNASITDKMLDCIKYLDTNGYRRERLIMELLGYLVSHPTAWKNKWNIVISLAGCRPDGKWIDACVAQDDFRSHPTINDKPYYIWPSEED